MAAPPPPLIRCHGVANPNAKALNGLYEFQGTVDGRPCYHQTGVSSGNHIWFSEDGEDEPTWFITPKGQRMGGCPDAAVAKCRHRCRWPWETSGWLVCGKAHKFVPAPGMQFQIVLPGCHLTLRARLPALAKPGEASLGRPPGLRTLTFRGAGEVNDRPAYQEVSDDSLRLFWMPKMARWLVASLRSAQDGGGIAFVIARSHPDDGSSWASMWPWEARLWDESTCPTLGLVDGDASWVTAAQTSFLLDLCSPAVTISGNPEFVPDSLVGTYEPKGMANGRVYYVQRLDDIDLENSVGPKCLWFAEDRGQWVITDPTGLGESKVVCARVASRAWWPWEAHLGGSTAPATMGAVPFDCLPEWFGGATILAGSRAPWEIGEPAGGFHKAKDMAVNLCSPTKIKLKARQNATLDFIGTYEKRGICSSRPFFVQDVGKTDQDPEAEDDGPEHLHALWYTDELEQWVVTTDYRMLDPCVPELRVHDTAWFPWEVTSTWEVADISGGFIKDTNVAVQVLPPNG